VKVQILACTRPGEPPSLAVGERDLGDAGGHRVLVDVAATSVNPIDVKRAAGGGRRLLSLKGAGSFPTVLGNDVAGVVRAAGPKSAWRAGQRVFGLVPTGAQGAHASAVLADARWLRPAPEGLEFERMAALPYTFTTMMLAVRSTGLTRSNAAGRQVLVNGASGGLGRLAMQLLVAWGARITAVCSTPDVQACERLGAAEVLDRRRASLASLPARFDASLNFGAWSDDAAMLERLRRDALGHATAVHPLLENVDRHGWIGGLRATWREFHARRHALGRRCPQARYRWVTFRPDVEALDQLGSLLAADAVSLPIGLRVPLQEAAAAFTHVRDRRPGRALLLPTRP